METISEEYRELNRRMHLERPEYGVGGHKWAQAVRQLAKAIPATTILDYGAGKRTLEKALGFGIANYDPAIEEISAPPEPADLVVCTDVLEHIEPERLEALLDDLRRLSLRAVLLSVATRAAKKHLPDGRNAHLIQEPMEWWMPKLWSRWRIQQFTSDVDEFFIVGEAR